MEFEIATFPFPFAKQETLRGIVQKLFDFKVSHRKTSGIDAVDPHQLLLVFRAERPVLLSLSDQNIGMGCESHLTAFPARHISRSLISCISCSYFWR